MLEQISATFTRPSDTTAYTSGDLVANSTTAGSVIPLNWNLGNAGGYLMHSRLEKTDASDVSNATFTLHLFGSSPTVANGDNGAISFDIADRLDSVAFAIMVAATDDAYQTIRIGDTDFLYPIPIPFQVVYGLIEVKAAYTPASAEVFTCYLTYEQSV